MRFPRLLPCLLLSILPAAVTGLRAGILEDRAIEDAIESSYVFQQVLTDRSMVMVYVRHGAVELRGQVADDRERALLGYTIAAIPNVTKVENLLFVDSANKRNSSRWRALRIRAELLTQTDLDLRNTRIAYSGERWEFAGTVASDAQRSIVIQRIAALAATEPLHVNLELASGSTAPAVDDASITAMVRIAIESLPGTPGPPPAVSCIHGAVRIGGSIGAHRDLAEVTRLAATVRGVKSVDNRMIADR